MAFDPERLTLFSDGILGTASSFIGTAQQAGLSLLGLFAVLDLVLFGLAVALGQRNLLAKGIWKLLLIGVVLLLVRDGGYLIDILFDSALYLAKGNRTLLPDPVGLMAVGITGSLDLMRLSADSGQQLLGASMSLSGLAIAMVVTFGLAAGALLYQLAAFHVTAGVALVMLPIGLFSPGRALLGRAGRGLLTATVRLAIVTLICLPLPPLLDAMMEPLTRQGALDMPLAQLCLGLCLLVLLLGLPRAALSVIGDFSGLGETPATASTSIKTALPPSTAPAPRGSLQAAALVPQGSSLPAERLTAAATLVGTSSRASGALLSSTRDPATTASPPPIGEGQRSSVNLGPSAPGLTRGEDSRRTSLDRNAQQAPQAATNIERLVSDALRRSLGGTDGTSRGYRAIAAGARTEDEKDPRNED
ncbi:type IV secretion system protein [Lacibacterium aquatile]|uniref:Type IV secretion system protein n=1 Tax=Lacibacterium aquatile TaxID=1168082 RepID=A0ABW5DMR2_9PROT